MTEPREAAPREAAPRPQPDFHSQGQPAGQLDGQLAPSMIPGLTLVTIVHGREQHLARQLAAIDSAAAAPELHVIVAMDDPAVAARYADRPRTIVVECPSTGAHLPLAGARNAGAAAARERGAEVLVFLDVDCLPASGLFSRYDEAVRAHPGDLVCGAVGYLPEGTDYDRPDLFADNARFHGFRPRLDADATAPGDHLAFWSLSFATTPDTWQRIGGFFEGYSGYGGEDTDFAVTAREAGVPLRWVGGAEAFHQYHSTTNPPVQHVDDIVRNGALFAERWGFWPMQGWLDQFVERGLVRRDPTTGDYERMPLP